MLLTENSEERDRFKHSLEHWLRGKHVPNCYREAPIDRFGASPFRTHIVEHCFACEILDKVEVYQSVFRVLQNDLGMPQVSEESVISIIRKVKQERDRLSKLRKLIMELVEYGTDRT